MSKHVEANQIALHFINKTQQRATDAIVERIAGNILRMFQAGYAGSEIKATIDYIVEKKKVDMYSFGYVESAINSILAEMKKQVQKEEYAQIMSDFNEHNSSPRGVITYDSDSAKRNKAKFRANHAQSRQREKPDFDMP